jgi:hypothetical protein
MISYLVGKLFHETRAKSRPEFLIFFAAYPHTAPERGIHAASSFDSPRFNRCIYFNAAIEAA